MTLAAEHRARSRINKVFAQISVRVHLAVTEPSATTEWRPLWPLMSTAYIVDSIGRGSAATENSVDEGGANVRKAVTLTGTTVQDQGGIRCRLQGATTR